ncbi:MAG: hypothetical protein AB1806_15170 [Acidobacteriota bacterium]
MTRALRTLVLFACAAAAVGVIAFHGASVLAQQGQAAGQEPASPPINQSDDPILKPFVWRSIGPANMGGRIDDIAAVESDPSTYYVGFATGGIWKTVNNGTTFTPIFDTYPVSSIGDIAIAPSNPNIIYAGTGEPNNRQSSSFGDGVYKSTDAGKTWTNVGLKDTQSIARIVVHPTNPDIAYVAAVGHLFGSNRERGLFKTTDGGTTWTNTKFIDEDTGFTDVVMDPKRPDTLYAASYQRRRTPHGFNGGGPGSALWKTTNGGRTWTKLQGSGLPEGLLGRIGLDVCRTRPNVVYAQIEVGASAGTGGNVGADGKPLQPGAGRGGAAGAAVGVVAPGGRGGRGGQPGEPPPPPNPKESGVWRSDDYGKTWRITANNNNRPMYYSQIRVDPNNPDIVYTMGAPFFKSTDGGKTFNQVRNIAHGDHHALWINPQNSKQLILGNDGGLDVSYDQGETWDFINTMAVGQFYQISADMRTPYYVCGGLQDNGSWCGPSAVRSSTGILNQDWFRVGGGDGFYTSNDPTDWMVLFSQSQDGNVNRVDLREGRSQSIRPRGRPQGRGGAQAAQLAQLAAQVGFGGGRGTASNIVPEPPEGTEIRFFWNTPTVLSPHNPRIVYIGGNRLFISRDRGDTFTMTADLTRNLSRFDRPIMGVAGDGPMASKHDGVGTTSVITTAGESPVQPGVLWVGTNDGNLQVSRDGGTSWKNVAGKVTGVPDETHVSRVEPSHFDAGTCYVTFDAHRTNDHKPYVSVTRDFGETWSSLSAGLPMGNANVVREDLKNRNLLFLGTEYAFYVSLDAGKTWKRFMNGLPSVRIDDILIHPRDNDLIVGTHGRSIWILDDITPLQQLSDDVMKADATLFEPRAGTLWRNDIQLARTVGGNKHFRGQNPEPGTAIAYHLKTAPSGDVKITISDITGKVVREITGTKDAGINRVQWNLRGSAPQPPANVPGAAQIAQAVAQVGRGGGRGGGGIALPAGKYLVKLTVNGKDYTQTVEVKPDLP